jgi:hypothetical protein
MTLKSAALLAFVGTMVMTVLLVWNFVFAFLNVLRDLVPAVSLFSSFVYAFGCFAVMVFFLCSIGRSSDFGEDGSGVRNHSEPMPWAIHLPGGDLVRFSRITSQGGLCGQCA